MTGVGRIHSIKLWESGGRGSSLRRTDMCRSKGSWGVLLVLDTDGAALSGRVGCHVDCLFSCIHKVST